MNFKYAFFGKETPLDADVFGMDKAIRVKQCHSNTVIRITEPLTAWIAADAIVTDQLHLPIGVITADCVPVLLEGQKNIAAIHAGWRGALGGIIQNAVTQMHEAAADIQAFIGPCIRQNSYEVSKGFEEPFIRQNPNTERFFKASETNDQKLLFDLAGYCHDQLAKAGITHIASDGRDTVTDSDFHSHRGGATQGERNLSVIMIERAK